ncbi:MAG: hypothetical protein ACP5QT_00550 [Brevinematia bacterium]
MKNLSKKNVVFSFENTNQIINREGKIFLKEIKAGNYEAYFETENKKEKRSFTIEEGDTSVLVFNVSEKSGYRGSWPLMNILLPGFAQVQGEDYLLGLLFMTGDVAALGFSGLSIFAYTISEQKYRKAVTENDKTKFLRLMSEWNTYMAISLSAWVSITFSSVVHAYYMQNKEKTLSYIYLLPERDALTLNLAINF